MFLCIFSFGLLFIFWGSFSSLLIKIVRFFAYSLIAIDSQGLVKSLY